MDCAYACILIAVLTNSQAKRDVSDCWPVRSCLWLLLQHGHSLAPSMRLVYRARGLASRILVLK